MQTMHLILEPAQTLGGMLQLSARLEGVGEIERLWWRVPLDHRSSLTPTANPFILGLLFPAMLRGGTVHIHGQASPSLLRNFDSFMAVWRSWQPTLYHPVQFTADSEQESPPTDPHLAIVPFSCGADSSFTTLRHARNLAGRRNQQIAAAAVFHGFDIWLDQTNADAMYKTLHAGATAMLSSLNIPCIPLISNFHELKTTWAHSFGTQLASGLSLFSARFGQTLIPNNIPFNQPIVHWGSTPVTDHFLGSSTFPVHDDGGEFTRIQKIRLLASWPEAMQHLRVCFNNPGDAANCCACEKCIRTILALRIADVPRPGAFPKDVTNRQISRARFNYKINIDLWTELVTEAHAAGLSREPWVKAIHTAIRRGRRRHIFVAMKAPFVPLRNSLRKVFRGSSLSRRQLKKK